MLVKHKKTLISFVSLFCSLCFVVTSLCVYKTGLFKGLNLEVDRQKEVARLEQLEGETVEGIFLDRSGLEITSYAAPGKTARVNDSEAFSYLIGYRSPRLKTSGLRDRYYTDLLDGGKDGVGATIQLTVNADLQKKLYGLLQGSVGSVSVINAATGEVLALASRGDPEVGYDVNLIDTYYDEEKKLFYSDYYNKIPDFWHQRAVFADDPPGSCAKIVTAVSLVENGYGDLEYNDTGREMDQRIHNYNYAVYGFTNLEKALNKSVNTFFANASANVLGGVKMKKTYNRFMVGKTVELDFATLRSTYLTKSDASDFVIASNGYGQGELMMAPLHLAMTAGALMNEGVMMKPYVVKQIVNDETTTYEAKHEVLSQATDSNTATRVKELLHSNAVYYGLHNLFSEEEIYIIAKTGTADVREGKSGNHIYYTLGCEIDGVPYGICIDQASTSDMSGSLKTKAISVLRILMDTLHQ